MLTLAGASLACLALAVHKESRGESMQGKVAVAMVLLNRADGDTTKICSELKRPGQWVWYKKSNSLALVKDQESINAAKEAAKLYPFSNLNNIEYFHSKKVKPYWIRSAKLQYVIGNHKFYSARI